MGARAALVEHDVETLKVSMNGGELSTPRSPTVLPFGFAYSGPRASPGRGMVKVDFVDDPRERNENPAIFDARAVHHDRILDRIEKGRGGVRIGRVALGVKRELLHGTVAAEGCKALRAGGVDPRTAAGWNRIEVGSRLKVDDRDRLAGKLVVEGEASVAVEQGRVSEIGGALGRLGGDDDLALCAQGRRVVDRDKIRPLAPIAPFVPRLDDIVLASRARKDGRSRKCSQSVIH